jgi:DNA-binding NarL/FixJ family response regulator
MKQYFYALAIHTLAPGAEWKFNDDDLDTLEWFSTNIEQPSKEAIIAQAKIEERNEQAKLEEKATARQSALAKLIDLGLTEEEIAAL